MVTFKRMIFLLSCLHVVAGLAMQDCYGMVDEHLQDAKEQVTAASAPVVEPTSAPVVEQAASVESTPVVSVIESASVEPTPAPVAEEGAPVVEPAPAAEQASSIEATPVVSVVEPASVEPTPAPVAEAAEAAQAVEQAASVEAIPVAPSVEATPVVEPKVEVEQTASVGGTPLLTTVVKEGVQASVQETKPVSAQEVSVPVVQQTNWTKAGALLYRSVNFVDSIRNGIVSVGEGMWNRTWHPVAQADMRSIAAVATYAALGAGYYYRGALKNAGSWLLGKVKGLFSRTPAVELTVEMIKADATTAQLLADKFGQAAIIAAMKQFARDDAAMKKLTAALVLCK